MGLFDSLVDVVVGVLYVLLALSSRSLPIRYSTGIRLRTSTSQIPLTTSSTAPPKTRSGTDTTLLASAKTRSAGGSSESLMAKRKKKKKKLKVRQNSWVQEMEQEQHRRGSAAGHHAVDSDTAYGKGWRRNPKHKNRSRERDLDY